ncbi:MAG: transglutaminase domain-containing protein [Candidatus Bathyarchaeota archaeon]
MKQYARLLALLIVLTISVGMLSTAINILGDITRLELDETAPVTSKGFAEAEGLSGGEQQAQVGYEAEQEKGPILLIRLPTKTMYLRRYAAYNYTLGTWTKPSNLEPMKYTGQLIPSDPTYPQLPAQVQFQITPMANLTGYMLVAQHTDNLNFNQSEFNVNYYEDIQSFDAVEPYDDSYWVSYKRYMPSQAALRGSQVIGPPESYTVPDDLRDDLTALALQITVGKTNDYDKLTAIRDYLLDNYEFDKDYMRAPSTVDPIRWFLYNERKGVGSHFNTAFTLMARTLNIPARVVVGYTVKPDVELQYVLPQQAYMYAEAEFQNQGWVTFDACPKHYKEGTQNNTQQQTFTNITGNDPIAIRGKQFNVWGTVKTVNDTAVTDTQVEIILKVNKTDVAEEGLIVGVGEVIDGVFNVTCDATPEILVGDYNLIAHSLETAYWLESFSDPPITVMAEPVLKITGPRQVYEGRNITYRGSIVDSSDGSPIVNTTLKVRYLNQIITLTSDAQGKVSYVVLFPENGKAEMSLIKEQSNYYLGAVDSFAVTVIVPPPDVTNIIALLFTFPYNIGIALTGAMGVGIMASRRNKRLQAEEPVIEARVRLAPEKEYIGYEDGVPLEYTSYEEGVVKLFNRFFVSMQRIYPDVDESMTPREFQYILEERLPHSADALLEDLVSSYEIAMYSNITLSQEDFKRTNATIELIIELMKNAKRD